MAIALQKNLITNFKVTFYYSPECDLLKLTDHFLGLSITDVALMHEMVTISVKIMHILR